MMQVLRPLKGFGIEATDGSLGSVVDFLFDDASWKVRWLVVECGSWWKGHRVLMHPSAITATDTENQRFQVDLTKEQVASGPDWSDDLPVSQQMLAKLYDHYGWDAEWGAPTVSAASGAIASPLVTAPFLGLETGQKLASTNVHDAHLRSFVEIVGYEARASNGDIGVVENFMMDDENWTLRYLVVDTGHWWFGTRILLSTAIVKEIDWSDRHVRLEVTREEAEASPPWDPRVAFEDAYAKLLHRHYGWAATSARERDPV